MNKLWPVLFLLLFWGCSSDQAPVAKPTPPTKTPEAAQKTPESGKRKNKLSPPGATLEPFDKAEYRRLSREKSNGQREAEPLFLEVLAYSERAGLRSLQLKRELVFFVDYLVGDKRPEEALALIQEYRDKCAQELPPGDEKVVKILTSLYQRGTDDWERELVSYLKSTSTTLAASNPIGATEAEFLAMKSTHALKDEEQTAELFKSAHNRLAEMATTDKAARKLLIKVMSEREDQLEELGQPDEAEALANQIGQLKDYDGPRKSRYR